MSNCCCDKFVMIEGEEDSFETWQGLRGPYYTPSVSEDGTLSWTNNGDLQNPADVNIKGPPGPGGVPGGTTGQLLAKASDDDFDTEWIDAPDMDAGGVTYDPTEAYDDGTVGKELGTINSALSSLQSVTEIIDTASGTIASFPDGAGLPMRSFVAEINPVQDLHGYDAPWPAGGGKNKLNNAKAGTSETIGIYTFASNADGSVVCSGTGSATANFFLNETLTLSAGTYTMCILDAVVTTGTVRLYLYNNATQTVVSQISISTANASNTFTLAEDATLWCYINVASSGATFNGKTLYPMIVVGSTAPTAWAPYSNICPISGWQGLSGQRTGVNLFDGSHWNTALNSYNIFPYGSTSAFQNGNVIKGGQTYTATVEMPSSLSGSPSWGVYGYYEFAPSTIVAFSSNGTSLKRTFSISSNKDTRVIFWLYVAGSGNTWASVGLQSVSDVKIQIEPGSTASTYEEYQGEHISVTFPTTVYGGTDEVISGNGTSTMGMVDLGDLTWYYSSNLFRANMPQDAKYSWQCFAICSRYAKATSRYESSLKEYEFQFGEGSIVQDRLAIKIKDPSYSDVNSFKAAMSGVQLCYELATPQSFTHDPQEVDTIYGQNNVFVDTGNVEVTYQASIKGYIDKVLAS